ncbi:MAG: protein phosphatase 2C domain-containing protein [Lachnospiraceae bacterium]|nr:protein phosphatase 2C domain-containing protein [Lachnospiraceae bacterium]
MNFKIAAHTDVGIRKKTNQDSVLVKVAQTDYGKVCLASVCDGMGGLAKGELASATAVRCLSEWFETEFPDLLYRGLSMEGIAERWRDLIYRVNERIGAYGSAAHIDLGTTMVVLLIVDRTYYFANVGDSRIYVMRDELSQLTKDQTFIQREMDEGRMTWEEARRDPRRNVLLQCVGASREIEPAFGSGTILPGSIFLLCSDGFRHVITGEEIYQYLSPYRLLNEKTMQEGLVYLTDLDKYRKESDNISTVLIRCD